MVTTEPLSFLTRCKLLITSSNEVLFAEESFYNKFDIVSNTKFNLDLLYGEETEKKSIAEFKKCCEDCCYGSIFITLYKAPVGIGPYQRNNQQCAAILWLFRFRQVCQLLQWDLDIYLMQKYIERYSCHIILYVRIISYLLRNVRFTIFLEITILLEMAFLFIMQCL